MLEQSCSLQELRQYSAQDRTKWNQIIKKHWTATGAEAKVYNDATNDDDDDDEDDRLEWITYGNKTFPAFKRRLKTLLLYAWLVY